MTMRLRISLTVLLAFACGTTEEETPAEETTAAEAPPEVAQPYEEGVAAQAQIDTAVARAGAEGKHVLLIFGGNWCVWCRRLEWVLRNDPQVSRALRDHYYVVHVDTGARRSGVNADVVTRYGDPLQHGLPCLVVLDGHGTLVHTQETGSLENGDRHDPARVLAFLNRFSS